MIDSENLTPPPVQGLRRFLYVCTGLSFVGLGALGTVLPILPTTPFLLLASFFFIRSSPRLHAWLLRSKVFGPFLRDWQKHRGVRPHVKVIAISMLVIAVCCSAFLANLRGPLLILLLVLATIGLVVILRLHTIREPASVAPLANEEEAA